MPGKLTGKFCKEFESLSDEEKTNRLCLKLKGVCDKNGIDINPTTSAELFHNLAVVHFRKSPDKTSLIQTVGLLNAAIKRKPKNIYQIEKDLEVVCKHILHLAKAQNKTTNLILQAQILKSEIASMRDETDRGLAFIKTVSMW